MENKALRKLTKHHVFMIIYGVLALSAIAVFWIFKDNPFSVLYVMAALWLVLPVGSMVVSYAMSAERGPKGLTWLLPVAFGATMCAVEFLTLSLAEIIEGGQKAPSITLMIVGAFASLIGFTFAKQDRVEKERAERARKKKEAKAAAKAGKKLSEAEDYHANEAQEKAPETVAHEDDYNPSADFIPDENDTWADEVLEREGYGKEQVEYAESDPDFSIDLPEENGIDTPEEIEAEESIKDAAEHAEETEIEPNETEETEVESAYEELIEDGEFDAPAEEELLVEAAEEAEENLTEAEDVAEEKASDESAEELEETNE